MDNLYFGVSDTALVFGARPRTNLYYTAIIFKGLSKAGTIYNYDTEWNEEKPIPIGVDYY